MEPLWGSGHLWEPRPELQLQLKPEAWFKPCLGLWPGVRETLSDRDTSTFPKFGVNDVDMLTELAAATLWDLSLTSLGFMKALIALARVLTALVLLTCLFLSCFLAKRVFLRNFGSISFLMPFVPFSELVVHGGFLGLAISALKPAAPGTGKVSSDP